RAWRDLPFDHRAVLLLRSAEVVGHLEVHPEVRGGPEEPRQAERSLGGDRAALAHDLRDARRGDAELDREAVRAHREGLQELLAQNFPRMDRGDYLLRLPPH